LVVATELGRRVWRDVGFAMVSRNGGGPGRSDLDEAREAVSEAACRDLWELVPAGGSTSPAEEAEWVKDHFFTSWASLKAEAGTIPSRGAVLMLYYARTREKGLDEMMTKYWLKAAGKETGGGSDSGAGVRGDDGRKEFGILKRLRGS